MNIRCFFMLLWLGAVPWMTLAQQVRVTAGKVAMSPQESQTFRVRLVSAEALAGTLSVGVEYGLSDYLPVDQRRLVLEAGKPVLVELSWTAPRELWGACVRARFTSAQGRVVEDRYVFSVHENVPMTCATMGTLHSMGKDSPSQRQRMREIAQEFADAGISMVELHSWTPDLWGENIVPKTDWWRSGQGNFLASKGTVKAFVTAAHSHGIKVYTYAQPCYSSMDAKSYKLPPKDYLLYRGPDGKVAPTSRGIFRCFANPMNQSCLDSGLQGYAELMKEYDLDGIRWDGQPGIFYSPMGDWISRCNGGVAAYPYDAQGHPLLQEHPDRTNTLLVRYLTTYLSSRRPGVLHGYNLLFGPKEQGVNFFPGMLRELFHGNLILQERHFHANASGRPLMWQNQKWSSMIPDLVYARDLMHHHGGYLFRGDFNLGYNQAFLKHAFAFSYAGGSRLFAINPWYRNVTAKEPFGMFPTEYCRFALRFNRYLLSFSLRPINVSKPLPRILVSAKNPFPVIYEPFCYDMFVNHRYTTVINLLNTPASDQVNIKTTLAPSWRSDDTVVSVRTPLGINGKAARYYALSPEFPEMIRELHPENSTQAVVNLQVPSFQYWCVVVCDYPLLTGEKPVSSAGELFLPVLHRPSDPL